MRFVCSSFFIVFDGIGLFFIFFLFLICFIISLLLFSVVNN